jgi:class 3 adenylate cyclase
MAIFAMNYGTNPGGPMSSLRTVVLMKTDIAGSTPRFRALLAQDQQSLLRKHRAFVAQHASDQDGRIVRQAGDGFWIEFSSATSAALAAMAMQEALRLEQPIRGDDRLSMRIVVGLGDIGDLDGEMVGELLALIVRIEAITPADEIYLTPTARLALMPAEVQTSRVDLFALKGFTESVEVYRVEQRHRSCILPDAYIVISDLRGFTRVADIEPITTIERILTALDSLTVAIAHDFGGTIRYNIGDSYCMTFTTVGQAIEACELLLADWGSTNRREQFDCAINVALHRGNICAFRTFLYGKGIAVAARVQRSVAASLAPNDGGVFVTSVIREELAEHRYRERLVPVALELPDTNVYRLMALEPVIPNPEKRDS